MEVIGLTEHTGAEIRGVDASQTLDDATQDAIRNALAQHGVILLRDQSPTPDQQVAFTAVFGKPETNFNAKAFGIDGSPEIYLISNVVEGGKPIGTSRAGATWHTDMSYAERPAHATMLHAKEVPHLHGLPLGDTQFANSAAAYEALPEATKERIKDLRGIFDFRGRARPGRKVAQEDIDRYPPVEHPIVRTHPVTGRKGLFVARDDCTGIAGWDKEEGLALVAALADHIVRPEFVYRHRWCVGDIVVWDNCTVQHKAVLDYDLPLRRLMWRTTVGGEVPF
jgi:taurine dioxygenase